MTLLYVLVLRRANAIAPLDNFDLVGGVYSTIDKAREAITPLMRQQTGKWFALSVAVDSMSRNYTWMLGYETEL